MPQWLLLKLQLGGVPEAFFQKGEIPTIDRIKEILYEIVNAQQGTAASISEDGDTNEEASTQPNIPLDPVSKEIVEKIQGIINSPQAISSDEDSNIDEQIDEYAKLIYQMLSEYGDSLLHYSNDTKLGGDVIRSAFLSARGSSYPEYLIYQLMNKGGLAAPVLQVMAGVDNGDYRGVFSFIDPYSGVTIDTSSSYEGLQLIGHTHSGDSDAGIQLRGSRNNDTANVRISDKGIRIDGYILGHIRQLDSSGYSNNALRPTEFKEYNSNEYVFIGHDNSHPSIQMRNGSATKFTISSEGILNKYGQSTNYVFASGRMLSVGDSKQYNGVLIFPAIAPLITSEYESKLTGTSECYVPNCYLKNVKSLSSTAEITYNDKTYTLNMDKAIELGLFVESTAAAATSEESIETA